MLSLMCTVQFFHVTLVCFRLRIQFDSACSMVSVPSVCVVAGSIKLRDHLLAETFRKGVPVPKCLRSVVDLATLAAHFYPMQFSGVTQDILSPRDIAKHLSASIPSQVNVRTYLPNALCRDHASSSACVG